MSILGSGTGKKEFMTFQAFEDVEFKSMMQETVKQNGKEESVPLSYRVMINPDQFSKSMSVSYSQENAMTNSVSVGRFANMQPIDYDFSLVLDGTGVVPSFQEKGSVKKQLNQLKKIFFKEVEGGIGYKPNYVSITYCDEIFFCVITSFRTDYQMFNPDGSPLRAKVTCSFKSVCMKEPEQEGEDDQVAKGGDKPDGFLDAISMAKDKVLDSLFELSI